MAPRSGDVDVRSGIAEPESHHGLQILDGTQGAFESIGGVLGLEDSLPIN